MYIEPSTNIRLLNGVHLDPTYQHTIYFADATAQATYFISKTKHNLTDYYFQRKDRGIVKVKVPIGQLYDCNYMMYKNTEFSNKWFYAFITNVEYANNGSSYVYFQIDVMQTWFFDYEILPSFVLRDHAMTDVAGDNIVPEEVQADSLYLQSVSEQKILNHYNIILASAKPGDAMPADKWDDPDDPDHKKYFFDPVCERDISTNMVRPYKEYMFGTDFTDVADMNAFIQKFIDSGQAEAIMGIYPRFYNAEISLSRPSVCGGNYTPRNKKLLTGQYCRYTFELAGNIMEVPLDAVPNPTVTSRPRGLDPTWYGLNIYKVFLSNYNAATCPTSMSIEIPINPFQWAYSNYANTIGLQSEATAMMLRREETEQTRDFINAGFNLAKGSAQSASGVVGAIMSGGSSLLMGGTNRIIGGAQESFNAATDIAEIQGNIDAHSEALSRHRANLRAPATGASVNSNALMQMQQLYLSGYVWTPLRQDAERIDKFFDMYGYAQNVMKIPNRNGRTHWNYVKTAGLEIHSNCPQEDMATIVKIYENGITFWNNGDEVGNYNLDNTLH